jgi:hypothetical protein
LLPGAGCRTPATLWGAWERGELTCDGRLHAGLGRAVWLQAGRWYVDVRGPGGFASDTCFAGSTKWEAPYLTWAHDIDRMDESGGMDRGHMTFEGDDLIEQGEFIAGMARSYRERWCRLPGPAAPLLAARAHRGLALRVGDHAAAVVDDRESTGAFTARYWRRSGPEWELELSIDDGGRACVPEPLDPNLALANGWRFEEVA